MGTQADKDRARGIEEEARRRVQAGEFSKADAKAWARSIFDSGGSATSAMRGGSIVHSDRGDKFDRSGMEEIGTTGTGITDSIDLGSADQEKLAKAREKGAAILYDDVTGKLYATSDWSAVQKNWDSLVDVNSGQRQKLFGISQRTNDKGEAELYTQHAKKTKPFGVDVTVGYNEVIPEAGTEEFQDWVNKKFSEGVEAEKAEHRWTSEEGWINGKPGHGDYFSVSYEDWMAKGAPRKVGGMRIQFGGESKEENREIRQNLIDAEGRFDPDFMLGGANYEDESHGFTKTLDTIGSVWGNSNFGENVMDFSNSLAEVPILGSLSVANKLFLQPFAKYEAARDAGRSAGDAIHETGEYMLATSAKMGVEAVITAIGVVSSPFTAGASLILAGAALGALNSAGSYAIDSVVYGGTYAEQNYGGDIWDATGKGAAMGAITAGVAMGANALVPNAAAGYYNVGGSGGLNVMSIPTNLSSLTHAAIVGAGQYAGARIVYGADNAAALAQGVGGALSGYSHTKTAKDAQAQKFFEAHPEAAKYLRGPSGAPASRSMLSGSAWGSSWSAFRELAAESPLTSWAVRGGTTDTGKFMKDARLQGFNRPGVVSSAIGATPYGKVFGIGKNRPALAMGATDRADFVSRMTGDKKVLRGNTMWFSSEGLDSAERRAQDTRIGAAAGMYDAYFPRGFLENNAAIQTRPWAYRKG